MKTTRAAHAFDISGAPLADACRPKVGPPDFEREPSQPAFQAASRAAFEIPLRHPPGSRPRSPGRHPRHTKPLWSRTPPMTRTTPRAWIYSRGMPNFDPGAAAGSSQFSMYESRGAASDSDQLTDEDLPTPGRPSKRLQVLGVSEVSSLPPSGNLGGRTHVSDSQAPAAGRSIIVRADEFTPAPTP
ncbi:hypothetical protein DL769_003118 [Monosporascus sp. CRB-8-3]|nr:hypothetical protein DL769_003118 [Monosporascus sp. CRB-8-3]